jgi:hypothetical protein
MADEPAIRFQLCFAGPAHANPATEFLEVSPQSRQSRQRILQLRKLHLHLRFGRARTRRENVENELGAIDDALVQHPFEILALRGGQLVIEHDQRRTTILDELAELLDLARTEIRGRIGTLELLRQRCDDSRTSRVGETGELFEMLPREMPVLRTLERSTDENRALFRRRK